jgi:hypothetical protein
MNRVHAAVRKALVKLLLALVALIGLILTCFSGIDRGVVPVIVGLIVLIIFPSTILFGIDASRVIRAEASAGRAVRVLGRILGIPQAIMGIVLIAFGVVYPFFGVRDFIADLSARRSGIGSFIMTLTAIAALFLGYYYLREGLGIGGGKRRQK